MYQNIIPNLVSIDSKDFLYGGNYFLQSLDFFASTDIKAHLHYVVKRVSKIEVPEEYDFRSEYFIKKGSTFYYKKDIGPIKLRFSYDIENKVFTYNKAYGRWPFQMGGIMPISNHLSDIINFDLFMRGLVNMRGSAFRFKNKVTCLVSPGCNGKTTFLVNMLEKGAEYIAEDNLVIDYKNHTVFPTQNANMSKIYGRETNGVLAKQLKSADQIVEEQAIDNFYFVQNSMTKESCKLENKIKEHLLLNSLYFFNNIFIKTLIFDGGHAETFMKTVDECTDSLSKIAQIHRCSNFNYEKIL